MAYGGECRIVLVAEDDVMLRNLIRRSLESAGFVVLSAADGEEALALSRAFDGRIDVLVTDFDMQRMNGSQLIAALRQERPGTAPILMSGMHSAAEFGGLNATFLPKPFEIPALVELVERLIRETPDGS